MKVCDLTTLSLCLFDSLTLIFIFFLELFILYLLSGSLTKALSYLFHSATKNKNITIYLLWFFFLPGTIIHELSHLIMAKILFVYTGKIHLLPKAAGNTIRMGSVDISRTDPLRRFMIGIAPFVFGTSILLCITYLSLKYALMNTAWKVILILYLIFQLGNTMFASKKDLEGTVKLVLLVIILFILLYLAGIRINAESILYSDMINSIFLKSTLYLLIPISIDLTAIFILSIINRK